MADRSLSPGQEALWFLHRVAPGNAAYNLVAAARVALPDGRSLDAAALGRAFRLVAERHPELRATFSASPSGEPVKRIHERLDPDFRVVDATGWSEREIADRLTAEAERPFDLERGPLARIVLLTGAGEPRLLFAFHHIVADFWSLSVIARELGALYDGAAGLPPLRAAYDDHVRRERERLEGPRGEKLWEHWSERLRDAPDLALPADHPRPPRPFHRGGSIAGRLDADLAGELRVLARRRGATLFATLLAGFQALLSRTAGQTDFVVGSPSAGRSSADLAGTVGYFVRPLALRADLSGAPSGEELVARAKKTVREALAHQALPFPRIAERLRPVRVPGKAPLFQAMLVFHQSRGPGEEGFPGFVIGRSGARVPIGSLSLDPIPLPSREVPFDLTLTLAEEADGGLAAVLDYSADLFDATTALRTAERFERLLTALAADPLRPVEELPLLGEAEAHQVLSEWNDTGRDRTGPVGLYRRFAAQAERAPEAVALIWEEERISYRELERRARGLAAHLGRLGVGPERIVGVSLPRSPDLVVTLLGVLAAGGAYLPLDPAHPRERLERLIEDSGASLVIGREELDAAGLPEAGEVREPVEPGALAYVLYTSGSTGKPKGVAVTHGAAAALLDWAAEAFRPEELAGVFAATSIVFDLSVFELFAPLSVGGTVILGDNVLALHGLPAAGQVTLVNTVPSAMAELLRQGPLPESVRAVALAGEPLPAELIRQVREAASRARVLNLYGPTEDTVYSTAAQVDGGEPGGPPIGRPLPGTRAVVLDANLWPAPIGVAGELWLAGAGLARGYLLRPDLTAERFLPDPHGPPGGRLYRTGDRARLRPDGAIELLGRVDHQVKVRGFRIELGEVEAALLSQSSVREAAAGVREVGGERVLAAWVVASSPVSELRAALAASLPAYMVPSLWVEMAALPRAPSGKVDRRSLPEPERGGSARVHAPPRDPVEEALAAIWREVLEVEAVGVDESFFELGGHSLLAMRLLARIRRVFGVELPVHALFERPTIALLARAVVAEPPRPAPPLAPVPREGETPLSYAQERLWFLDRLAPGSAVYNMPGAFRLSGPTRPEALARAFSEVVRRHEALRTRFMEAGGRPVQAIDPPAPLPLPVIDLGGLSGERRDAESRRLLDEEARRPFDLQHGPLLRTTLQRLGPEEHRLQVTAHHIVADGWSLGLLAREVAELIRAGQEGWPAALPPLPIQYADFARWQREWLSDEVLAFQLAAWRERLAGAPVLLDLPTDRPRPAVQSFRGGRRPLALPPELTRALHALARSRSASPFMALAATLLTLLGRYARSEDVLLGTPAANRRRIETEPLIGLFVNTLVLRGDLSGDPTFGEMLGRVRETALAAYLHQDLPFEKLVEELAPERSLSHSPLVQVVLVVEEPGWGVGEREPVETGTAKFDLTFDLAGEAGSIEFRRDLFDEATIDRLAGHFLTLLAGADPGRRLSELPLLTAAEQRQLAAWNATAAVPREGGLHERFERQAALAPEAVAVVFGEQSLTYGELDARANRLARRLRRLGVRPETPVGLCVERSLALVVGILGTLKAGGAYVPLDPAYPQERLAFTLEDARPAVLLTEERLLAALPASPAGVVLLDREDLSGESPEPPRWETDPDQLAYVIYTSGSTGQPKGALISHANVTRLLAATADGFGIGARDVWTMFHSHAFDFSVWEIWGALAFGGRLVIVPQAVTRSPEDFLRLLARERVTVLNQTPSAFLQLAPADLPELRLVIFGGEALEVGALDSWLARSGGRPLLVNMYGITETTVHVTWRTISERDLKAHHSPIGVPIPDLSVHLLDGHGREVPVGVPGEICVGGAGVGRGYLARPGLTAERFVPDSFAAAPGARLYRSGDLARRRPDGQLDYLGRIDQQVKIRGFRIELGEIEAVLAQHPKVAAAAVALRDRRLVAYWVPREEGDPQALAPALRAFLKERLPEPMIPAAWVGLREMPLTRSGKIDRRKLPEPQEEAGAAAAPLTPTEEILAGLWAGLLGRSRFGPEDDFFAAGGHSLLVTQLVSRLRQTFGVELAVRELFESPTLAALAERIDAALGRPGLAALPPIEPAPRDRPLPLSFAQQRLWLLDRLEPGGSVYNIPLAVRLSGPVDVPALARALEAVIDRHEALRTRYVEVEGEPVQETAPRAGGPALPRVDLSALPAGLRESELRRLLAGEAERPFDLAAGSVIRALLVDSVFAVTVHHIASDGWSAGVLVRELGALYRGETLPPLPVQYSDFAVWQRRWLQGEVLGSQLAAWRERLAGLPPLELWTDRPRPPVRTSRGRQVPLTLPESVWQRAGAAARRQGSTSFMALLAALQGLLSRWSGQTDFGVGFPVANRRRPETEGLIGLFVNTLVLRGDLAGDPAGAELLRRTREAALGAYAHQDLPFEKLVEELNPERSLGRSPLFQVLLALNAPLPPLDLGEVMAEPLDLDTGTAKFDLSWLLRESGGGLAGTLEISSDLFDAPTAWRMAGQFERLLAGMADAPERRISDLPLLSEAESAQLVREWNDTGEIADAEPLPERIARQAERTPGAVALVAGAERLTYRELEERAARLAGALRGRGVGPEVRVAVCLERSADLVAALLAVWKAGGAYVPLDPAWPRERLSWMLEDSGASVAIGRRELLLGLAGAELPVIDPAEVSEGAAGPVSTLPGALAYVLYTSGSTGRPKGVTIPHASVAALALWAAEAFAPEELAGVLAATSVCFDLSVFELFVPLSRGGTVILAENALALSALPAAGEVALVNTVPSALAELVRADALPAGARTVCLAGEPLRRDLVDRLHARPGLRVLNLYGPSEDTTYSTFAGMSREERDAPPIGRPIAGTRVRLLDAAGRLVPLGAAGELCLAGAGLARGYLGRPDLTAERFVPDPLASEPGARLYRTGDLARFRSDGQLEFLGRIDHQVKVRGFRIEPGEVEAALRDHPAVREAAVVVREIGEGDRALVAWLRAEGELPDLRDWLLARLPEPFVPAVFAVLEALPLTPSGKVDHLALSKLPLPGRAGGTSRAPRTPLEEAVAAVWAEALGVERVGAEDDFFALGGHSLLAARVASRLALPLRALFEAPTVERLARLLETARPVEDAPLVPVSWVGDPPLSFAQERLWLLDRLEGGASLNTAAGLHLSGDLDVAAMAAALSEVARRNEVLRTSFPAVDGIPRQAIAPPAPVLLPVVDLGGLPDGLCAAEAERLRGESALTPFDLAAAPPWRTLLLQRAPREHELLFAFHHIVTDGWSVGVFTREVGALYAAGSSPSLPEPPVQYADFALWQRQQVDRGALERWRERLAGDLPSELLSPDRPRRARRSRAASISRVVPPTLATELRALARAEGASLYMVLLAALAVLLGRHGGNRDVVVGSPVAGRTRPETEGLLGCFLNTLALRLDLAGNPSFRDLLSRAREVVLEALADQDVPFERVLEEVRPDREIGRTPLFQVLLNMLSFPRVEARLPGLDLRLDPGPLPPPRFDLTLYAEEAGDEIRLGWVWDADLFEPGRRKEVADQLGVLLEQIARDPDLRIEEMSLVTPRAAALLPDPAAWIAREWHGTVQGRFALQALRRPDALAVSDREVAWTYGELLRGSRRLAHALLAGGVRPGDVVAIHAHRSAALARAVLGVLEAGAVFLILDRDYPAARLAAVVRAARPKAWLQTDPAPLPPELEASAPDLRVGDDLEGWPDSDPGVERDPDAPAWLAFTSGSTGTPKGIVAGQRPLSHFLNWHVHTFGLDETDRFSLLSGLSHDPLLRDLFTPLWLGAALAVPEPDLLGVPGALAEWMAREAVTVTHLTPAMAQLLTGSGLPALRYAFFGGDALLRRDVDRLRALAPRVACVSFYGATETPQAMGWHAVSPEAEDDGRPVPLGRGIDGVQLLVLNAAGGLAGLGETGEVHIRTPYLALGYLNDEALTRERFLPNQIYRTGDLGAYLLNGEVRPLGRADRQIKIRGFRVEPAEIEAALAGQPGVREAVVVWKDPRLAGYVVPADPDTVLSPSALRGALRDVLPPYMVPAALAVLPALPLTPNGKVDRAALPDPGREEETGFVAPRDPIEALLAEIWAGVLGVERVGVFDEFFALGGHSLLATQVVSRVREACGVDLPLRALFEAPTLESLARRIEEARRGGAPAAPPIRRVPREGDLPLSFAQQRLWFLDQMEPGSPNLHLAAALSLAGTLDVPALEAALREVVRRHETLRTTFGARDGRPFQTIAPSLPGFLPVADLRGLPRDARRQMAALAWSPFDLARGPLLRSALLRLDEREHVLLLTLHHIVSDGWSTGVLFEELTVLYEAFRTGRPSPLPELPVQYADFASWQREWLCGEVLAEQLAFWRDTLGSGRFPVLELPADRPRPAVPTFRGARRPVLLPRELASALQAVGRERGATLFMVLMAAFQALLHRYTGQEELLVGSPVANRTRVEIERLIGMFFNLLAFRADLADDPAFSGLLARVRESALAAYLHQDLPFEKLLEELQPERHLSRTPLFQVTLVLQNAPRAAVELPGLTLTPLEIDSRSANFDLNLQLTEAAGEVSGWLEYRTDLFDAPTVDRMAGHLRNLLEGAAADPAARISRLSLLSPGERFQLLAEWNDTRAPFPADATMHGLFEAQAARTPDAVAVLSAERSLTYRELDRESARLARRLHRLGVGPGVPVGVSLERSADMVVVLLGILRAGGFYVPLDPAWPEARIQTILSSLSVPLVLAHPSRRTVGIVRTLQDLEEVAESELPPADDPEALAYVIFTSGSTGVPKGVMVQHRPVINLIHWVNRTFGVGPGDRLLFVTSLAFDLSVYDVFGILAAGGTVRVASEAEVRDPEALARALCREPVTFWDSAPAALAQVVPFLPAASGDRSRLRLVFLSGDWIPLPLPGAMKEAFPNVAVIALGGATEATVWSNFFPVRELAPHWVSVPYGRPIPNARYLVLDGRLEPCPIGVPGDLYIGGECLLAGYSGDPELSAAKILPDPYGGEPGGRLYRTGDRARFRPDGNLEFLGRVDQQVKIRGYRIELGEIEAALTAHPAVRDAVAVAREQDGPRGDKRLVAYVVQNPSYTGEEENEDDPTAQVDRWQVIYDEVYSRAAAEPADATLNLAGWISSYTGEPFPEAEMRGWVESTVERILAQGEGRRLGRVLEIGCGTGMLLFRIAPRCRSYHATDLSEVSLHYVRHQLTARGLPEVTLARRAADDWSGIEPGSFDAVILNSVTQHFPGADYLRRVVSGAVRAVAPGGFVFVGDVRSLPLLHAFHASVQRAQAPGLSRAQLGLRVRQRAAQEEELLVDPRFFAGLAAVDRVEIQLKRGRNRNEMSRFRFDAVLHVGPGVERLEAPWQDWTDLARLRRSLESERPDSLGIRGIPDDRLREEAALLAWLDGVEGVETAAGVEPEDLWSLGRELGYEVEVRGSSEVGRCDALFWRAGTPAPAWPLPAGEPGALTNNPLQGAIARTLVPLLRAWLADRVPEYMMPRAFVLLDALPLTANGKVDRRALPAPDSARPGPEEELVAPGNPAEQQLAAIWSEVLGLERVGVHDNFFELGGDSILSIQVIARAQQVGLRLSPRQIFQHQTIAELAAVAGGVEETAEEQGPVTGPVPITPIQRWFFEQELADPHQWNLAVMLELLEEVRPEHFDRVAARLLEHHDALRLRFRRDESGWTQWNPPPGSQAPASTLDLSALSPSLRTAALESAAAELQKSLDLEHGPLQRFALFRCGPGGPDRLLLTFHHLVIDGVSWRILLEDLQTGLRQLARGEEIRFPPKTASYRRWAESLAELDRADEAGFWLDPVRHRALSLPGDGLSGANLEGTARTVKLVLDAEETRALLREVPEAYKTRIDDVLLTALARAFFGWTGSRSLLLDLEGHGRGDLLPELDLSRTVGWFTAIYPVLLTIGAGTPEDDLKSVKEQLRQVPAGGAGYGLLRYTRLAEELARLPQAQVIFNNLGQLDSVAREGALIRQARESFGATRSPRAARRHLLEIYASVLEGRLELDFEYSASVHREATIRRLADGFLGSLRELIDRCRAAGTEGAQSFTPSDFPEADLDQEDLDLLMEQLG